METTWQDASQLGFMLASGVGATKNEPQAIGLFRKACDGGELRGCLGLGSMFESGQGVAKDEAQAAKLYRKACDAGNMAGCTDLGNLTASGRGVAKDEAAGFALYKKACDGGDMNGCVNYALAYESGQGVAKDEAEAAHLFQQQLRRRRSAELHAAWLPVLRRNRRGQGRDEGVSTDAEILRRRRDAGLLQSGGYLLLRAWEPRRMNPRR